MSENSAQGERQGRKVPPGPRGRSTLAARSFLKATFALMMAGALAFGMVGCSGETTEVKSEKSVSTPSGTTTTTETKTTEKSGDAPPAAP